MFEKKVHLSFVIIYNDRLVSSVLNLIVNPAIRCKIFNFVKNLDENRFTDIEKLNRVFARQLAVFRQREPKQRDAILCSLLKYARDRRPSGESITKFPLNCV